MARLSYIIVVIILLVPMAHLTMRLHPWAFLLSVWIPAFLFVIIGWYYRDHSHDAMQALQSEDCNGFMEKRYLQQAYQAAQELYDKCGQYVSWSIEECPKYPEVYELAAPEFTYLKSLESRFQCAGICQSAR